MNNTKIFLPRPYIWYGIITQACDYKRDRLCVRFQLEEIKYSVFLFSRSCNEAKRGVDFDYSTRNASRYKFPFQIQSQCLFSKDQL